MEKGTNGLDCLVLRSGQSSATVYLHGAHVTSWNSGGKELLFVSKQATFSPPSAIRGGIPICWPQFGKMGPVATQHGFARNLPFEVKEQTAESATLTLRSSEATLAQYPHPFELAVTVTLGEGRLTQALSVRNTGDAPMPVTAALHTYFRVADVGSVEVAGLQGCRYMDNLRGGEEATDAGASVTFAGEVDRVYLATPDTLEIREAPACAPSGAVVRVHKSGFSDAVVWNPWAAKARAMADFGDEEYREMVCVEVAQAGSGAVAVAPGETWAAQQTLELSSA